MPKFLYWLQGGACGGDSKPIEFPRLLGKIEALLAKGAAK